MIYCAKLTNRGILRISGSDRLEFLQGLLTNDIYQLTPKKSLYSLLLTANGKHSFDLFLTMVEDEYWLEADRHRLEELKKKLSLYKLRSKVSLEIDLNQHIFCLYSDESFEVFDLLPNLNSNPGYTQHTQLWHVYTDPRLTGLGARIITTQHLNEITQFQSVKMVESEDYRYHRYGLGVPESSTELPVDKSIPLENGMDELNAISWDKGCYIGQELTARTKYRGLLRKRLLPFTFEKEPELDTPIMAEGIEVGQWRGICRDRGLALLRLEALQKPLTCDNLTISVIHPNWMQLLPK